MRGLAGRFGPKVACYLDHLGKSLMVRRLEPFHANLGKRLVKSPKVYVRDSGPLHHLPGPRTVNDMLGHPAIGASWEGFYLEQIANGLPAGAALSFYRTAAGAEAVIDNRLPARPLSPSAACPPRAGPCPACARSPRAAARSPGC